MSSSLIGSLRSVARRPLSPPWAALPFARCTISSTSPPSICPRFQPISVDGSPRRSPPFAADQWLFSTSTSGGAAFSGLTDTKYPKRRPGTKPRRKRASLKPPGPYAWVQYVPGEPIPRSRPNEGSVQGRNEKKRIKQRKAFILAEKKKRKAQYVEFRKKGDAERIQRKMAAVAREKAWAGRLLELQKLEEAKKATMA